MESKLEKLEKKVNYLYTRLVTRTNDNATERLENSESKFTMETQREKISALIQQLSTQPVIKSISKNQYKTYKLFLNDCLQKLGITRNSYSYIISILKYDYNESETHVKAEQYLQAELVQPFIRKISALNQDVYLPVIILSFIFQHTYNFKSLKWIDDTFINSTLEEMIHECIANLQNESSPSFISVYSPITSISHNIIKTETLEDLANYPRQTVWGLQEIDKVRFQYLTRHITDHYNIPHYHVSNNFDEIIALTLLGVKRTLISSALYNEGKYPLGNRLNYSYTLCSMHLCTPKQIKLLKNLHIGTLIQANLSSSQLKGMELNEIQKLVFDLNSSCEIENVNLLKACVTDWQLSTLERLNFAIDETRVQKMNPIVVENSAGALVNRRTVESVPLGDPFNIDTLLSAIVTTDKRTEPQETLEFILTPFILYSQVLADIPTLSLTTTTDGNMSKSLHMTAKVLHPNMLNKVYLDRDIKVSTHSQNTVTLISSMLSSDPLKLELKDVKDDLVLYADGGVLAQSLSTYSEAMVVNIINNILFQSLKLFSNVQSNFKIVFVNSNRMTLFNKMWRDHAEIEYMCTSTIYYGNLQPEELLPTRMNGQYNFISLTGIYKTIQINKLLRSILSNMRASSLTLAVSLSQIKETILTLSQFATDNRMTTFSVTAAPSYNTNTGEPLYLISITFDINGMTLSVSNYSFNIANASTRDLALKSIPNPISSLPVLADNKVIPRFNLEDILIPPGLSIEIRLPWNEVTKAVGFCSMISDRTNVVKFGGNFESEAFVWGTTSMSRVAYLKRAKVYRHSDDIFKTTSFSLTQQVSTTIKSLLSLEELVTQTDRMIIYMGRMLGKCGSLDNSLCDFGSGYLLNLHQTKRNYVMYDQEKFDFEAVEGISLVHGLVKLEETLPILLDHDVLIYNSLYFIPSLDILLSQDGSLTKWLNVHFKAYTHSHGALIMNLPYMNDSLYAYMVNQSYQVRQDKDDKYQIKLNTYPYVECFTDRMIQEIITFFINNGKKVSKIVPSYSDYDFTLQAIGREATIEKIFQAEILHRAILTLVVM